MPIEPPPTPWTLPSREELASLDHDDDLVAIGADLEPGTLLAAYRVGLFPMPHGRRRIGWWCPQWRGVLRLEDLKVSRSLRRSARDFEIRVDTAFDAVVDACADPRRPDGWIDDRIKHAYGTLHRLGWAHSVEAWREGRLAGGLYGVAVGGLFAGESMFHHERDASKVALMGLVRLLQSSATRGVAGGKGQEDEGAVRRLVDVQWLTPHLGSLGVTEVPRAAYLEMLPALVAAPLPAGLLRPDDTQHPGLDGSREPG